MNMTMTILINFTRIKHLPGKWKWMEWQMSLFPYTASSKHQHNLGRSSIYSSHDLQRCWSYSFHQSVMCQLNVLERTIFEHGWSRMIRVLGVRNSWSIVFNISSFPTDTPWRAVEMFTTKLLQPLKDQAHSTGAVGKLFRPINIILVSHD